MTSGIVTSDEGEDSGGAKPSSMEIGNIRSDLLAWADRRSAQENGAAF
jgi:hypothetical protein